MKTSSLIGLPLNWAIETALGGPEKLVINPSEMPKGVYRKGLCLVRRNPSVSWRDAGPFIEEYRIGIQYIPYGRSHWGARIQLEGETYEQAKLITGPTPLIAIGRCLVRHKLGEKIQIPQELLDDEPGSLNKMDDYID